MSYSNSDNSSRVPDFNAQYGFSRVMLTLSIVATAIILPQYYTMWWAWIVAALVIFLLGHRYKERELMFKGRRQVYCGGNSDYDWDICGSEKEKAESCLMEIPKALNDWGYRYLFGTGYEKSFFVT